MTVARAPQNVERRAYKFLEPMDYINMRLTGKFAATQNTALPTLMVDNRTLNARDYHPWQLKTRISPPLASLRWSSCTMRIRRKRSTLSRPGRPRAQKPGCLASTRAHRS